MGTVCGTIPVCGRQISESDMKKKKNELYLKKKYENSIDEMVKLFTITDTVLGVGSFGRVVLAESNINREYKFAVKIMSKEIMSTEETRNFREIWDWIKLLDHPSILKYYALYENEFNFYLVMEYFEGNQLLDVIIANSGITDPFLLEQKAKKIIY